MFRLLLLALLSTQALGQPAADILIPIEFQSPAPKEEKEKAELPVPAPTPAAIGWSPSKTGLGLTAGDLKLFSGHALNLLKTKCPNMNPQTIFQLQKYFGKQIAKANPVPGSNPSFQSLLKSVTTCSSQITLPLPSRDDPTPFERLFVLRQEGPEEAGPEDKSSSGSDERVGSAYAAPGSIAASAERWVKMSSAEKRAEVEGIFDATEDKPKVTTSIPTTTTNTPTPTPKAETSGPRQPRNPFVSWIADVFSSISTFFSRIFGGARVRRSTEAEALEVRPWGMAGKHPESTTRTKGQMAFIHLLNEVCRVYCNKCSGTLTVREFRMAGYELLDFMFESVPSTGIDLAASHYLTQDFMRSLAECLH